MSGFKEASQRWKEHEPPKAKGTPFVLRQAMEQQAAYAGTKELRRAQERIEWREGFLSKLTQRKLKGKTWT
jgi:hypothetical protein